MNGFPILTLMLALARMQIGIRNTDSSISSSAIPSIPSFQANPANSALLS